MIFIPFLKKYTIRHFCIKNNNLLGLKIEQTTLPNKTTFKQRHISRPKQKIESGRSMVEMIGVLALIGLLSIGGIMGFRYTLNSHRAGQIQDIVSQSKVLAVTKKAAGQIALESFLKKTQVKNNDAIVNIAESTGDTGRKQYIYTITLDNVPNEIQAALYIRKPNFAKMDIFVQPSQDALDDIEDTWVADGMKPEIYQILSTKVPQPTDNQITFAFVTTGRGNRNHTAEEEDPTPSACPSDQFYDEATNSCVYCDPSDPSLHWDPALNKCVSCTGVKNQWDDVLHACICPTGTYGDSCISCDAGFTWDKTTEKCVECVNNTDCTDPAKPICSAGVCAGCPTETPHWDTGTKKCVECINTTDCTDPAKPVCSAGVCAGCPDGRLWNTETKQCVECLSNSDCPLAEKGYCNPETKQCEICKGICFKIPISFRFECPEAEPGEEVCGAIFYLRYDGFPGEELTEGTYQAYAFDTNGTLVWLRSTPIPINEEIQLDLPPGKYTVIFVYNTPEQRNGAEFNPTPTPGNTRIEEIRDPVYYSNTHGLGMLDLSLPEVQCW